MWGGVACVFVLSELSVCVSARAPPGLAVPQLTRLLVLAEADSAPQQRSCSKDAAAGSPSTSSFLQLPPPGPPITNSLASGGHPIMGPGGHHMPPHHPMMMAPHPPILGGPHGDEYLSVEHDAHDLMRPTDFLMKGIQEPIMGLMKILNPWNILNRFRG